MNIGNAHIYGALNQQTARQREVMQHSPRPSRIRFSVQTSGVGETRLTGLHAIDFSALMLEEPSFSFGVVAVGSLPQGQLPLATATVLKWNLTKAGLYTGAELGFKVECANYAVRLKWSLTFEGSTLRASTGNGTGTVAQSVYQG